MMKFRDGVNLALVAGVLIAAMLGCQKQEGPVERAGKEVDKAMDKAGQQVEKAADSMRNVPPKEEGPIERAGKAVDKAVDKTGEQVEKAGTAIQETVKGDKK